MQKSIKLFLLTIAVLTIGFFLTSCGKEKTISTFDFKETSYTIELDAIVNVELNLEEAVIKENIVYASANPEVATPTLNSIFPTLFIPSIVLLLVL